jgi:hypothetical protein
MSVRPAVRPRWRGLGEFLEHGMARLSGAWSPTTASDPIIISPSPVIATTRRAGCARATPSAVGTASPMPPQE